MKKQLEVRKKTKMELKEAFWELYCYLPMHKITVRLICEKAGYNRSTFYEYFLDIYDVLEQIENTLIAEVEKYPLTNQLASKEETPMEIAMLIDLFEKNRKYFLVLLGENGDPSFQMKLRKSIKPKLKMRIANFGVVDNDTLDLILDYNISAMTGILHSWLCMKNQISSEAFIRLITELTANGALQTLMKSV